jgi:hypothetical protein
MRSTLSFFVVALAACGSNGNADGGADAPLSCEGVAALATGDEIGHPEPLGALPTEARAGRVPGSRLPQHPSGLGVWDEGGYLLANDRVAMLIEDAGPSQLYDPWGGRPLAIGRVAGGAFVDPADFGEILILAGRYTVMTTSVTVLDDGSDGSSAIVRAVGPMRPLPFFEAITSGLLPQAYDEVDAAIDYELAPGSSTVEIDVTYASRGTASLRPPLTMHGFMYTPRLPMFAPGLGFAPSGADVPWIALTDERGASFAYQDAISPLRDGVEASGFVSRFVPGRLVPACATTTIPHARITIGNGRGVDALLEAVAEEEGTAMRTITGFVRDALGGAAIGARVHATDSTGYLTRSLAAGGDGDYELHVPATATGVQLWAYRQGDLLAGPVDLPAGATTADIALGASGEVHVRAVDEMGAPLPARIQILPTGASTVPSPPGTFGERLPTAGRLHVVLSATGDETMRVAAGTWRVVVSRGYEFELVSEDVTVAGGDVIDVVATLSRVVETPGVMCGDFHIHTARSNDSPDDEDYKVRGAVADGVEIPVRSDHEFVSDFEPVIERLGLGAWAHGIASVEMTSMELWGHMGVVPLVPDETMSNGGTPPWQEWPTPADPTRPLRTMSPVEVFDAVRARPEQPTVIINHPRGGTNYFGYAQYDATTGTVGNPDAWDDEFTAVEIFNDASWTDERDRLVVDWLSFLDRGRRVFAVGSSDSHSLSGSPVGYPRTCLALGSDDPRSVVPSAVRDAVAAGRSTISGGIYVDANAGTAGPGDDAMGLGTTAMLHVRVQAASWVDVDALEVIVDGATVDTIEILPGDADPLRPHVRYESDLAIDVADGRGSYVIVAAYGDSALEPVHRGRLPFGATNPIFLHR